MTTLTTIFINYNQARFIPQSLALKYGACFAPDILAAWRRIANGFACSVSANPEKVRRCIADAEQWMRAVTSVFPPGYTKRWKARQEFDLRRAALARAAARSDSASAPSRQLARIAEMVFAAALLVTLRPRDAAANIRQRIDFYRGRI